MLFSCLLATARAQEAKRQFNFPADDAVNTFKLFSEQSGHGMVADTDLMRGVKTNGVKGEFTVQEAVERMLAGTSLVAVQDQQSGAFTVRRENSSPNDQRAAVARTRTETEGKNDVDVTKLSPFVVSMEADDGYISQQTLVGSRNAKNLLDIPTSVAIINQEMINDFNANNVSEVLAYGVSGVTQTQTVVDDFDVRGFRSQFVLRDGVTKTTFRPNPMWDVERIEVLKGPGALLLGNNDFLGGAINFITRKPTAKRTADVNVTLSSYNYVRLAANLMGPVVKSDDFNMNYRVTVGGLRANDPAEMYNKDQKFLGAGIAMYFGSKTSILVNGHYHRDAGYIDSAQAVVDKTATALLYPGAPRGKGTLILAKFNQYSTESFSLGRRKDTMMFNDVRAIDVTLLMNLTKNGYLRAYYSYSGVKDRRRLLTFGAGLLADNFTVARSFLPLAIDAKLHTIQLDYQHSLALEQFKLDTTLGADGRAKYFRQGLSSNTGANGPPNLDIRSKTFPNDDAYFAIPRSGAGLPYLRDVASNDSDSSVYLQENLSFLKERVILVGGDRFFWRSGTTSEDFINRTITRSVNRTYVSYKYGIVVKPLPWVSLYYTKVINLIPFILAGTGSTGNLTNADRFVANDGLGPAFKDSECELKEYGVKFLHTYSENITLHGSLVHFDMSRTNVRVSGVLPETGNIGIIQSAKDTTGGWEVDAGMTFKLQNGRADLTVTYFDGSSTTATDSTLEAVNFVPKKYSVLAKYSWTSGTLKGLMLGGGIMDESQKRAANFILDIPLTATLFGRYQWNKHWSTQVNLNNVTNKRYFLGLSQPAQTFRALVSVKYVY